MEMVNEMEMVPSASDERKSAKNITVKNISDHFKAVGAHYKIDATQRGHTNTHVLSKGSRGCAGHTRLPKNYHETGMRRPSTTLCISIQHDGASVAAGSASEAAAGAAAAAAAVAVAVAVAAGAATAIAAAAGAATTGAGVASTFFSSGRKKMMSTGRSYKKYSKYYK